VKVDRYTASTLKVDTLRIHPKTFAILATGIDREKWDKDRTSWKKLFRFEGKPLIKVLQEFEAPNLTQVTRFLAFSFIIHLYINTTITGGVR
jgi:hypothetical protein